MPRPMVHYDVNPTAVAAVTGNLGSATRVIRGVTWQVSVDLAEVDKSRITRDGRPVEWRDATEEARRFVRQARAFMFSAFAPRA